MLRWLGGRCWGCEGAGVGGEGAGVGVVRSRCLGGEGQVLGW